MTNPAGTAWPPRKIARLTLLVEAGMYSFSEIGEIMGITKNEAIGKARRLGLTGPRMTGPTAHSTLSTRLDAVLARARPAPIVPRVAADNATRPMQRAAR